MNDEDFQNFKQEFHEYMEAPVVKGEKRIRGNNEEDKIARVIAYKRAKAKYHTLHQTDFARAMNINLTTFRFHVETYDAKILAEAEALGWKSTTGIPPVLRTKQEVDAFMENGYTILCATKDNRVKV